MLITDGDNRAFHTVDYNPGRSWTLGVAADTNKASC
jgi:hypothetical protein